MAFDFDRLNASQIDKWGQAVTYTPVAGSPASKTGIFSEGQEFELRNPGYIAGLWFRQDDMATPADGDRFTVASVVYEAKEFRRDSGGGVAFFLRRV